MKTLFCSINLLLSFGIFFLIPVLHKYGKTGIAIKLAVFEHKNIIDKEKLAEYSMEIGQEEIADDNNELSYHISNESFSAYSSVFFYVAIILLINNIALLILVLKNKNRMPNKKKC